MVFHHTASTTLAIGVGKGLEQEGLMGVKALGMVLTGLSRPQRLN